MKKFLFTLALVAILASHALAQVTVKPLGGGDFDNLQAAIDSLGAGHHTITCYEGDCGAATVNGEFTTLLIEADDSAKCNPLIDAGADGFAHTTGYITIARGGVTLDGLRLHGDSSFVLLSSGATIPNFVLRNCQATGIAGLLIITSLDVEQNAIVQHCTTIGQPEHAGAIYAMACAGGGNSTVNVGLQSCTFQAANGGAGVGVYTSALAQYGRNAKVNIYGVNTYVGGYGSGDWYESLVGAGGTEDVAWAGMSHDASSDGTANDWGGSGHLLNQTPADWFEDVASDLRLKSGSPGIGAGVSGANIGADN